MPRNAAQTPALRFPSGLPALLGIGLCLAAPAGAAAQISLGGFTFDALAGPDLVVPLPGSQPEFGGAAAACGILAAYPGQSLSQSVGTVMQGNSAANWLFGRAVLQLDFLDNRIVNGPGADLVVFEIGGAENFRLSVFFEAICEWSSPRNYSVTSTGLQAGCGPTSGINARAVDLSDFGVLPGASVRRLLLENLGAPGGAVGSDLAQVLALNSAPPLASLTPCLGSFQQDVINPSGVYLGAVDTVLAADMPNTNLSAAASEFIDSDPSRSILLRFDGLIGPGPGQIPPGARIREARLHLATGASPAASTNSHPVHRLLQPFNAASATYASAYGGNGVQADGIEASAAPVGTILPMGNSARQEVLVTAAVQAWADGAPNHGLALLPGGTDGLGLLLSESPIATLRPALTVVIEPKLVFAEALAGFSPGPGPLPQFLTPLEALGAPDYDPNAPGAGTCSDSQQATVTVGVGGSLTLEFQSSSISGSGTPDPDLWIYERGPDVEATFVSLSADGVNWSPVGLVAGAVSSIDLDAFGFGPLDLFRFVRLVDDPAQGDTTGCSPGADIDAVAALAANPWVSLGGALAGLNGLPWLKASGALAPGSSVLIQAGNGLPGAPAILVYGNSVLNLPLLGGTLVPFPSVFDFGFAFGPAGVLNIPVTWPAAVPAGLDVVLQFWFADPGAVQGFAATNGIRAKTQ
jgi:hypothetical protein